MKEKSEQGNDGIFFGDADYRGVVWSITQTLFPRSLVPGQFKFIDLHPYALSPLPDRVAAGLTVIRGYYNITGRKWWRASR